MEQQQGIEAVATSVNWPGFWGQAEFDGPVRADALSWSGEDVRRYVASGRQDVPSECVDAEDSPCPLTGAGAAWAAPETAAPWWVEAQSHAEGPMDDEDIPRKLEGWWHVLSYTRDGLQEVGEDLEPGALCFVEKLWSDRVRVFRQLAPLPFEVAPLGRACDLQLMKRRGRACGSRWDLLRDVGEGGDDPDEIRVGQKLPLLGGKYGQTELQGVECEVKGYSEFMDRWTVEVPMKDQKGNNLILGVLPSQLRKPRMPREPRPNGRVELSLAVGARALELSFRGVEGSSFELTLRYASRVRPGGRVWSTGKESMYRYAEVRFVNSGKCGFVFRVLRLIDPAKRAPDDDEDHHLVLDVPRGSDKAAITRAYRKLARRWHPDKVPEEERERAVVEFRRAHQAYENLLADPERSSDLMVLKMQSPEPTRKGRPAGGVAEAFRAEVRCLALVSQLRLPNVSKLVEVGPDEQFIVTWPYLPEALHPYNERDGINQVNRVDLVRQGWSDYSRSRRAAQKVIKMMVSVVRHDVMTVDPQENILVDRESGEPLLIDFGRSETAGSTYTSRIKTFVKKVLSLLVRCVAMSSFDVAARFIRDVETALFLELERWQDERTRDQRRALALVAATTKWQEGIECCRAIWCSDEDNPLRKMFSDAEGVLPPERALREATAAPDDGSDGEKPPEEEDDDPEGLLDRDIETLSPVEQLLRAKRHKSRRAKLPREKPNVKVKVDEVSPDGKLGLGLDDAPEDMRGVVIVQVGKGAEGRGFEVADRIVELNGVEIDEWDDFRSAWDQARRYSTSGVVFGIVREGVELPVEPKVPKCLHCGSKGRHLQKCTTWKPLPEGEECVYFCSRDCQREAWRLQKRAAAAVN